MDRFPVVTGGVDFGIDVSALAAGALGGTEEGTALGAGAADPADFAT